MKINYVMIKHEWTDTPNRIYEYYVNETALEKLKEDLIQENKAFKLALYSDFVVDTYSNRFVRNLQPFKFLFENEINIVRETTVKELIGE